MTVYLLLQIIVISGVCALASMQDLIKQKVNNLLLWNGTLVLLIIHFVFAKKECLWFLGLGIVSGLLFFIVKIFTKKLGMADVWFSLFAGCAINWKFYWVYLLGGSLSALIYGLCKKGKRIPFVPFLSIGLLAAFVSARFFG